MCMTAKEIQSYPFQPIWKNLKPFELGDRLLMHMLKMVPNMTESFKLQQPFYVSSYVLRFVLLANVEIT